MSSKTTMQNSAPDAIKRMKKYLSTALRRSCSMSDGFCPMEADEFLNEASRSVITAYVAEYGTCCLGMFNPPRDTIYHAIREHKGTEIVCTFGANFVLPKFDAELNRMILARLDAQYEGVAKDRERMRPIMDMVKALGGAYLFWS